MIFIVNLSSFAVMFQLYLCMRVVPKVAWKHSILKEAKDCLMTR